MRQSTHQRRHHYIGTVPTFTNVHVQVPRRGLQIFKQEDRTTPRFRNVHKVTASHFVLLRWGWRQSQNEVAIRLCVLSFLHFQLEYAPEKYNLTLHTLSVYNLNARAWCYVVTTKQDLLYDRSFILHCEFSSTGSTSLQDKGNLWDRDVDSRKIERGLWEMERTVWTRFNCLRTESSGWFFNIKMKFGFPDPVNEILRD